MTLDCAAMIADQWAPQGDRLRGVDLVVAASAVRHGESVLSRNPVFRRIPGLAVESY